jgi:hypothetical protein
MNLSPKLRTLQQSYFIQYFVMPTMITFGGATLATLAATSHGNLMNLTVGSFKDALGIGGFGGLSYLLAIYPHSPGSASFHADGSENKLVTKVAEETQTIPGPAAATLDVQVVEK